MTNSPVLSSRNRAKVGNNASPSPLKKRVQGGPKKQSSLITLYLAIYNLASAIAWGYFAFNLFTAFSVGWTPKAASSTISLLCWVQSGAILEVFHAGLGLVRSPVFSTTVQICSRLFVAWIPGYRFGLADSWGYVLLATAWTLSDFTRYIYYLLHLFGMCPNFLIWARYSLFMILYPMGTVGEMILINRARVFLADAEVPYHYGLLGLLIIYPFGFKFMYSYMLKQRAKYLS